MDVYRSQVIIYCVISPTESQNQLTESNLRGRITRTMPPSLVVFTCTYFPCTSDLRYVQFLETLQAAKKNAVRIVVVDDSPDDVHKKLKAFDGRDGAVIVRQVLLCARQRMLPRRGDMARLRLIPTPCCAGKRQRRPTKLCNGATY